MKLEIIPVGAYQANCYIIGCEKTQKGLVIDPGAEAKRIIQHIDKLGLKVEQIVLTHGHIDHIGGVEELRKTYKAKVAIHEADAPMLTDSMKNLSFYTENAIKSSADVLLKHGDLLEVGQLKLKVIHTPGHTPGGICLLMDDIVFTGDTLFAGSIGRTDFPGGSYRQIIDSIKQKLLILKEETKVLPGHGPQSTIGEEKRMNPFLI
ncbi:MAG: hydroxyacylglutathione hydrolase [Thermosediminibacterales bacterium]|nr:hydroxyacylglutathione hydrolase [Thermosediminibacterales bacterium]